MSSATVRGPYPSVYTSFDPPWFSLDTTFKPYFFKNYFLQISFKLVIFGNLKFSQILKVDSMMGE
jgi:hypothetical protein